MVRGNGNQSEVVEEEAQTFSIIKCYSVLFGWLANGNQVVEEEAQTISRQLRNFQFGTGFPCFPNNVKFQK